jgi:hypothetical protein
MPAAAIVTKATNREREGKDMIGSETSRQAARQEQAMGFTLDTLSEMSSEKYRLNVRVT